MIRAHVVRTHNVVTARFKFSHLINANSGLGISIIL